MALIDFSNEHVLSTFTSPHSMNAWGYFEVQAVWRKTQPINTDGVTNMFTILNAAKASGRTVSGSYDDATGELFTLYLN